MNLTFLCDIHPQRWMWMFGQLTLLYQLRQGWTTSGSSMPCNSIYQMLKLKLGPHDIRGTVHNQPNTHRQHQERTFTLCLKKKQKKKSNFPFSKDSQRFQCLKHTACNIAREKSLVKGVQRSHKHLFVPSKTCRVIQSLTQLIVFL